MTFVTPQCHKKKGDCNVYRRGSLEIGPRDVCMWVNDIYKLKISNPAPTLKPLSVLITYP